VSIDVSNQTIHSVSPTRERERERERRREIEIEREREIFSTTHLLLLSLFSHLS
jgi:hypothetical protein